MCEHIDFIQYRLKRYNRAKDSYDSMMLQSSKMMLSDPKRIALLPKIKAARAEMRKLSPTPVPRLIDITKEYGSIEYIPDNIFPKQFSE